MAETKAGGVYRVGDEFQDANGKKVAAPRAAKTSEESADASQAAGGDALPNDFPAYDSLTGGGYKTLTAVRTASDEELDGLPGIGPATIREIRDAIGGV